ncbi:MAG: N-acetyltransferase [Clostridia bacterium]|nr:N-acetyltransferase [Clostridia bacterium]
MIRAAEVRDIPRLLAIYASAKQFMHEHGNPHQWNGAYPDWETLQADIEHRQLFVMEEDQHIYGCFALIGGEEPTYASIDGAWLSDTPYGTIHRIASDGTRSGVFRHCVNYARERYGHLRVDTHADNLPMQRVVTENGFIYTGIIYLKDGSPRKAYEWIR